MTQPKIWQNVLEKQWRCCAQRISAEELQLWRQCWFFIEWSTKIYVIIKVILKKLTITLIYEDVSFKSRHIQNFKKRVQNFLSLKTVGEAESNKDQYQQKTNFIVYFSRFTMKTDRHSQRFFVISENLILCIQRV